MVMCTEYIFRVLVFMYYCVSYAGRDKYFVDRRKGAVLLLWFLTDVWSTTARYARYALGFSDAFLFAL